MASGSNSVNSRCSCYCSDPVVMKTSWTLKNPARRFIACRNWRSSSCCGYFDWIDPDTNQSWMKDIQCSNVNLKKYCAHLKKENEDLKNINEDLKKVNAFLKKVNGDLRKVNGDVVKSKFK